MRENHRPHSFLVGMPVKHDVSIFTMGNWRNHRHTNHKKYHPTFNGHHNPPNKKHSKLMKKAVIQLPSKLSPIRSNVSVLFNLSGMFETMTEFTLPYRK